LGEVKELGKVLVMRVSLVARRSNERYYITNEEREE
jgi:hypothetical protein